MTAWNQAVVIDLGSGLTKAGFAGRAEPVSVFGSVVGRPKLPRILPTTENAALQPPASTILGVGIAADANREAYQSAAISSSRNSLLTGDRLLPLRGVTSLTNPIRRGVIVDVDGVEALLRHAVRDVLKVDDEHPMLITEVPGTPRANKEKLAKLAFECFRAPALHIAPPPALALYASGRTTGVVLDVGAGVSSVLSVASGYAASPSVFRAEIGGVDVDDRLLRLLRKSGASLSGTASERDAVRCAKERYCRVADDPKAAESSKEPMSTYELPDGQVVAIGAESFRAPEILFRPSLAGIESPGVAEILCDAIDAADMSLKRQLFGSVLITGGTSCTRGFGKRIVEELRSKAPSGVKCRVHAPKDRIYAPFEGATILASLTTFRGMCVSREQYFEHGENVIHRKSFY